MAPVATDTSHAVAKRQRSVLAAASVQQRAEMLVGLCEAVTAAAIAGIKHQSPNATDAEVRSALLLRRYGPEFVASLPAEHR